MSYGHHKGGHRRQHHSHNQQPRRMGRRWERDMFWSVMAGSPWPNSSRRRGYGSRYRRHGGGAVFALLLLLLFLVLVIHYWWIILPLLVVLVIGIIFAVKALLAKFKPKYPHYQPMSQPHQQDQSYQPSQSSQPHQYYQPDANNTPAQQQFSGGQYAMPQSHYPQNPPPIP